MAGNTFNISGQIKQGAALVTSGYVRVQNLNRSNALAIVPIGLFEDGTLEAGRYDAWFRAQIGDADVVAVGDIFEFSVFGTLDDAMNNTGALFAPQQTLPIDNTAFELSYLSHQLQLVENLLPGLPIISSEDNSRYLNNKVVYWTWTTPIDPDGDNIHFELQWAKNSEFAPVEKTYNTLYAVDRSVFSYEITPDNWLPFPSTGMTPANYGKRCRIRLTMGGNSAYYWRIRATDNIDR